MECVVLGSNKQPTACETNPRQRIPHPARATQEGVLLQRHPCACLRSFWEDIRCSDSQEIGTGRLPS
eukprot:569279-Rhodomonas_salina.2